MSNMRVRTRADKTTYTQISFRHNGKQSSRSFDDHATGVRWGELLDKIGPDDAIRVLDAQQSAGADIPSLKKWLGEYIDGLTGVEPGTIDRYKAITRNDIDDFMAALPLPALTDTVIARWVQGMVARRAAGKTIANKHGFLSAALASAVEKKYLPSNPCAGTRLPRQSAPRMTFLEPDEFQAVLDKMHERWHPFTLFLVTSGARFSEASALTVGDIDVKAGTCRIDKAFKDTRVRGDQRWQVGVPKTQRSIRTINLPPETIAALDLDRDPGERLFLNTRGRAVGTGSYYHNVWKPAVADAAKSLRGKAPRVHDMRHTCASWMIAAAVPLPVIQAHLGHESITTTIDRYGHLDRRAGAAAAAAISSMLRSGEAPTPTPPPPTVLPTLSLVATDSTSTKAA